MSCVPSWLLTKMGCSLKSLSNQSEGVYRWLISGYFSDHTIYLRHFPKRIFSFPKFSKLPRKPNVGVHNETLSSECLTYLKMLGFGISSKHCILMRKKTNRCFILPYFWQEYIFKSSSFKTNQKKSV